MKITFCGAASEVTGSCYLVEADRVRFLLDCGLFQGGHDAERKNLAALRFDVGRLDFVVISHAHVDHCGLLPRLARLGYNGPVFATEPTADLLSVMLKDSAHIQEKEAAWRLRHDNRPSAVTPLYTLDEVDDCVRLVRGVRYGEEFGPHPDARVRFQDAGHILGSAITEMWLRDAGRTRKLVFSGDLGQPARPLVNDPTPIAEAEILLVESTYGDRRHRDLASTIDELVAALDDTLERRRGNVIVPAFALGRTQELLAVMAEQTAAGRLRNLNVFVDSPLALRATEITLAHREVLDEPTRALLRGAREGRLPIRIRFVEDVEESKSLNRIRSGAVIIASGGMCEGGRIKHHLEHNLPRPECSILFTGFQAAGTLGRQIVDRAPRVKLFGAQVPVRAQVHTLGGLSAHADQAALIAWLGRFGSAPHRTFVVHGEVETARGFAALLECKFGWNTHVPVYSEIQEV